MRSLSWILILGLCLCACGDGSDADEPPADEPAAGSEEEPVSAEPGAEPDTEPGTEPGAEPDTGRASPDGMCGGIAGFACPDGQWCDMGADHPDASGTCRPLGACDEPADCEQQEIAHAMCVGGWVCADSQCGWECD